MDAPSKPLESSAVDARTAEALPRFLLARGGAALMLVAFLTGGYAAAGLTGQLPINGHFALAAHVTALLGAFWMFGLGWTLPMLRYGPTGKLRLVIALLVINFGGLAVNVVKAAVDAEGIAPGGSLANQAIFLALTLIVVVPTLVTCVAWVWGFRSLAEIAADV
jgi:hydroxylaminobenzene mutase